MDGLRNDIGKLDEYGNGVLHIASGTINSVLKNTPRLTPEEIQTFIQKATKK